MLWVCLTKEQGLMECHLQPLQFVLGYASSGGRFIRLLVDGWSLLECYCVEDGSFLPLWCLWREQNDRNFEDKERMIEELRTFFSYSLFSWTAAFLAPLDISFHDFLGVLDCALHFLMIFFSKIKNKKKSKENRRWEI
jgi:hypothetical protein